MMTYDYWNYNGETKIIWPSRFVYGEDGHVNGYFSLYGSTALSTLATFQFLNPIRSW
jgi:hypothetical protein